LIMKKLVVAGIALGALMVPAMAADMRVKAPVLKTPPPAFSWSGCYIGGNAGGAWENASNSLVVANTTPGYFTPAAIPGVNASGTADMNSSGFTGGGQVGCNWQSGQTVWGVEVDIESLNQSTSFGGAFRYTTNNAPYFLIGSRSTDWLFTARPRIGWAADRALFYVTGGLAVAKLNFNQFFAEPPFTPTPEIATLSTTQVGWTIGAGIEWALYNNWSLKGEYLFAEFDGNSVIGNLVNGSGSGPGCVGLFACGATFTNSVSRLDVSILRAGLNYRLY
jgi:outer membrane immunogenic protein